MDWWLWLIIIVVVAVAVLGAVLSMQARAKRGGVIVDPKSGPGPDDRSRTS